MKCSLGISNFLEEILVFPILLFSSISLQYLLRNAFICLLAILWRFALRWVYLSFSPMPFASLLFSATYTASSDNRFAFSHFFFLVLIIASCTMLWTSVRSSSGTLSDLIPWIYLSLPLYNHKGYNASATYCQVTNYPKCHDSKALVYSRFYCWGRSCWGHLCSWQEWSVFLPAACSCSSGQPHLLWGCSSTLGEQGPLSIMPDGASIRNKSHGQVQRQGGRTGHVQQVVGSTGAFM